MTLDDEQPAAAVDGETFVAPATGEGTASGGESPAAADARAAAVHSEETRPELFVLGAFVGAFVVAKLLGRLRGARG